MTEPITITPFREWRQFAISSKPKLTMYGYSRCRDKTFFHIPELDFGLDAGQCRGRQPMNTFITHTHADHASDLCFIMAREGVTVYVPEDAVDILKERFVSDWESNHCCRIPKDYPLPYKLVGITDGQVLTITRKTQEYTVRCFKCYHAVPCVGYAFSEKRSRLKEEYKNIPGKELAQLRKSGTEISETYYAPLFVYVGDTHPKVFTENEWLFEYPVIITECTFAADESGDIPERCVRDGHTRWSELEPFVAAHPDTKFVLIHFTLRTKAKELLKFFETVSQEKGYNNVIPFANDQHEGKV
eukprot:TRINITY_DN112255_c0_g1_i1.p1 TRINITY_DN112255_c0_g1~~TRINITY_DN112255_c0_g1_i1.p1  ORF type:complete len:301 (-),score=21.61 TRINITY_DN112255_c0_g1_i1:973-1875(-)